MVEKTSPVGGAGLRVDEVSDLESLDEICGLFSRIWRSHPAEPHVTTELLRALTKAGNYVAGAYVDGVLVGASAGFFAPPAYEALHSHISGVLPELQTRSVGFALKLHQRAWALERGARAVTWTFDPLVRRNSYFNLTKLGATAQEYLPDFYGPMNDEINGLDQTDRLLVRWQLGDQRVLDACARSPQRIDAAEALAAGARIRLEVSADEEPILHERTDLPLLVAIPADIGQIRKGDPGRAARWRIALREALGNEMMEGATVEGFDRAGWYLLDGERAR